MALDKKLELLDSYIANRMSPSERASFEQDIQADPSLLQEFHLQNEIVEGIRKARMAELKAMLSNVPIPATGISDISTTTKVVAGAIGVGIIATTAFFLSNSETSSPLPLEESRKEQITIVAEPEKETVTSVESLTQQEEVIESSVRTERKENTQVKSQEVKTTASLPVVTESSKVIRPSVNSFDAEDDSNNDVSNAPHLQSENKPTLTSSKIVAETDNTNKKYKFHYQLHSDRLILYGDFEHSLYEIIEVFNENKVTAFLYFKENYYLLTEEAGKIKQLVPIKDEVLLQKLKEYQQR
jgi:hypothetical protein